MEEEYFRVCKKCSNRVYHKNKKQLSVAIKKDLPCFSCTRKDVMNRPEERRKNSERQKGKFAGKNNPNFGNSLSESTKNQISEKLKGRPSNGMRGISLYDLWIQKYGKEEADIRLKSLCEKRSNNSAGSNNSMYNKPVPKKSGNGCSGYYKGIFFRSILELSYIINVIERFDLKWRSAESSDLKIKYVDYKGTQRTYVADFLISDKYLVECKPKSLIGTPLVRSKMEAAEIFCSSKGLIYKITCPRRISQSQIDYLVSTGMLIFNRKKNDI